LIDPLSVGLSVIGLPAAKLADSPSASWLLRLLSSILSSTRPELVRIDIERCDAKRQRFALSDFAQLFAACFGLRIVAETVWPARANVAAVASPIPVQAPVTTAIAMFAPFGGVTPFESSQL
jgi:hypothetical protein